MHFSNTATSTILAISLSAGALSAASVTPDVVFGSGNSNGSFTIENVGTDPIELGLRGKLRYNDVGQPENTFNWDGVDTYTFQPTTGTPANRSVFNFEWSINVEGANLTISDFLTAGGSAKLSFDIDPTAGVNFQSYDPFLFDAWYGTNATPNGGGTYAIGTPLAGATVAQNSVNYGFIPGAPLGQGTYEIGLSVFSANNSELGSTSITISVVPVPAALPLMLTVLGGLGFAARRRRKLA